jgi:chemotaxis response regulator CheB
VPAVQDSTIRVNVTLLDRLMNLVGELVRARNQIMQYAVTLDIEMPGMSGLQALAQIRKLYPKLPVIMFSALTEHGAAATLEALALGDDRLRHQTYQR